MTDGPVVAATTSCRDSAECTDDVRDDKEDADVVEPVADAAVAGQEVDRVADTRTDIDVDDAAQLRLPLTPDGGWGWMVVVASFVSNLIVDGVAYTFGIIMPDLIDHFDASKGKTAVVGSMIPGLYNIVGNRRPLMWPFLVELCMYVCVCVFCYVVVCTCNAVRYKIKCLI